MSAYSVTAVPVLYNQQILKAANSARTILRYHHRHRHHHPQRLQWQRCQAHASEIKKNKKIKHMHWVYSILYIIYIDTQ